MMSSHICLTMLSFRLSRMNNPEYSFRFRPVYSRSRISSPIRRPIEYASSANATIFSMLTRFLFIILSRSSRFFVSLKHSSIFILRPYTSSARDGFRFKLQITHIGSLRPSSHLPARFTSTLPFVNGTSSISGKDFALCIQVKIKS